MALLTSGYIALGGNVAGRSVAKELNDGAPNFTSTISLNDGNVRSLAQRTGSVSISMSHLRGKSAVETQTVTVGTLVVSGYINVTSYGYGSGFGSISDGTLGPVGNKTIEILNWNNLQNLILRVTGSASNSGFSTMKVHNTNFSRSSATYSNTGTYTQWQWLTISTNPFGTSGTKQVTFT
jgi:hypothetical protein